MFTVYPPWHWISDLMVIACSIIDTFSNLEVLVDSLNPNTIANFMNSDMTIILMAFGIRVTMWPLTRLPRVPDSASESPLRPSKISMGCPWEKKRKVS